MRDEIAFEFRQLNFQYDHAIYMKHMRDKAHTIDCIVMTYYQEHFPNAYHGEPYPFVEIEHICFQMWYNTSVQVYNQSIANACTVSIVPWQLTPIQLDFWIIFAINRDQLQRKYKQPFIYN